MALTIFAAAGDAAASVATDLTATDDLWVLKGKQLMKLLPEICEKCVNFGAGSNWKWGGGLVIKKWVKLKPRFWKPIGSKPISVLTLPI